MCGREGQRDRRAEHGRDGAAARKRHGRHYTPPRLATFLAQRMLTHLRPGARLSVLDPACGDGELLLAVARVAAHRFPGTELDLVGYDLDAAAIGLARDRRAEFTAIGVAAPHWRTGDFLGAESGGRAFDAVITNPPYVRTQQLGGQAARILSRRFGLSGRIDLTHPFVATVPELLHEDGVLGLLCANRFLTTKAGANLRALLHADLTPVEIYDLGDTRPFQAAVLPAVTIAVRGRRDRECRFVSAYEVPAGPATETDLYDALTAAEDSIVGHGGRCIAVEVGTLSSARGRPDQDAGSGFDPAIPWRISRPATDTWLERLGARTWRTFGEVARIRVGIKTTADRVFISDDWEDLPRPPEPELLLDLLTHHDIAPWRIERAQHTRVLYPYRRDRSRRITVDLREYPCAAAYLEEYRELLTARDYLVGSGREWFEIWVPQRPDLWSEPKVVFPDISVAPRFALDRSGAVVNGDCYWMSLADIGCEQIAYLLMGVANSTLGTRFYDAVCGNRLYAGRRRWITQYVARLPIPDPGTAAAGKLAALAGEFATGSAEPDLAALDELVAAAFGISPPSE